jgi:hypothetical protein
MMTTPISNQPQFEGIDPSKEHTIEPRLNEEHQKINEVSNQAISASVAGPSEPPPISSATAQTQTSLNDKNIKRANDMRDRSSPMQKRSLIVKSSQIFSNEILGECIRDEIKTLATFNPRIFSFGYTAANYGGNFVRSLADSSASLLKTSSSHNSAIENVQEFINSAILVKETIKFKNLDAETKAKWTRDYLDIPLQRLEEELTYGSIVSNLVNAGVPRNETNEIIVRLRAFYREVRTDFPASPPSRTIPTPSGSSVPPIPQPSSSTMQPIPQPSSSTTQPVAGPSSSVEPARVPQNPLLSRILPPQILNLTHTSIRGIDQVIHGLTIDAPFVTFLQDNYGIDLNNPAEVSHLASKLRISPEKLLNDTRDMLKNLIYFMNEGLANYEYPKLTYYEPASTIRWVASSIFGTDSTPTGGGSSLNLHFIPGNFHKLCYGDSKEEIYGNGALRCAGDVLFNLDMLGNMVPRLDENFEIQNPGATILKWIDVTESYRRFTNPAKFELIEILFKKSKVSNKDDYEKLCRIMEAIVDRLNNPPRNYPT